MRALIIIGSYFFGLAALLWIALLTLAALSELSIYNAEMPSGGRKTADWCNSP